MWWNYVIAVGLILVIAGSWVGVQYFYRWFALRHPEFGPARESLGCGMMCTCDQPCEKQKRRARKGSVVQASERTIEDRIE